MDAHKCRNLFRKTTDLKDFYFVHSYYFKGVNSKNVTAITKYSNNFPSVVNIGNVYGVQFHPEKSHKEGSKIIKNFILKSYTGDITNYSKVDSWLRKNIDINI